MIFIDYNDKRPIYEQVTEKIQTLILNGVLEPDSKLPSVRSLAMELSINPNTIQRAYSELEREGFIYSVKGRGNFVKMNENLIIKEQLIQEVIKMKINKLSAIILAGALTCTTPAMVYADTTSDAVDQAVSVLENSGVDDLLSDPDKVVDIIVAAKDAIGQVDVSDEEISSAIDVAASGLGISLTDSEKSTLVQLYNKFKNMNLDENELRTQITKVYDKLESLGITKDDVKGVIGKLIDIAKSLLN